MQITEIRIKLMERSADRLRAFCSITIDDSFVVRDLKIIDGTSGPFVAMPSRKLTGHCQRCNHKNHMRASYCNHCGTKQKGEGDGQVDSPQKLYADVAHPINSQCREMIQDAVISEFKAELNRSDQPGYRSRYDDDFDAGETKTGDTTSQPALDDAKLNDAKRDNAKQDETQQDDANPQPPKAGPPRPHFLDGPRRPLRESVGGDDTDAQDKDFGAGIF